MRHRSGATSRTAVVSPFSAKLGSSTVSAVYVPKNSLSSRSQPSTTTRLCTHRGQSGTLNAGVRVKAPQLALAISREARKEG